MSYAMIPHFDVGHVWQILSLCPLFCLPNLPKKKKEKKNNDEQTYLNKIWFQFKIRYTK